MNDSISLASEARKLIRAHESGVLATIDETGYPYASLVEYATLDNGDVVLLLSNLAVHTKNLGNDPRVAMYVGTPPGTSDTQLAQQRATLMGQISRTEASSKLESLYLKVHPHAKDYVHFADFAFYQLHVERVRIIEGFGRMGWIDASKYQQS